MTESEMRTPAQPPLPDPANVHGAEESSPAALPRAAILNYVAGVSSATRVRVIAARVALVAGLCNGLAALWLIPTVGLDILHFARSRAAPFLWIGAFPPAGLPPPRGLQLRDFVGGTFDALRMEPHWFFLILLTLPGAILLPLVASGIQRGRRAPSILALLYFGAAIIPVGLFDLVVVCALTAHDYVDHPGPPHPWAFLWLGLIPIAAIPPILLKDVCAFLLWIVRHPVAEKPPVPFLPGAKRERP